MRLPTSWTGRSPRYEHALNRLPGVLAEENRGLMSTFGAAAGRVAPCRDQLSGITLNQLLVLTTLAISAPLGLR